MLGLGTPRPVFSIASMFLLLSAAGVGGPPSIPESPGVEPAGAAGDRATLSKPDITLGKVPRNGIEYGRSKPNEDLTWADLHGHPIWIWAVDEETTPGQDETWVKSITSHDDVRGELLTSVPRLVLEVEGTDYFALGDFFPANDLIGNFILESSVPGAPPTDFVQQIQVHSAAGFVSEKAIRAIGFPVTLRAAATIRGEPDVRFVWESQDAWLARRLD